MIKKFLLLMTVVVLLALGQYAHAGVNFGVNADWNKFENANKGDWGVGARLDFGRQLRGIVTFEYYFVDATDLFTDAPANLDMKFWEGNADIAYRFPTRTVHPYIGGGVNIARRSFSGGFTDIIEGDKTKVGGNVLGGLIFGHEPVMPFVEFRGTFYSSDSVTLFPVTNPTVSNSNKRFVFSAGLLF